MPVEEPKADVSYIQYDHKHITESARHQESKLDRNIECPRVELKTCSAYETANHYLVEQAPALFPQECYEYDDRFRVHGMHMQGTPIYFFAGDYDFFAEGEPDVLKYKKPENETKHRLQGAKFLGRE